MFDASCESWDAALFNDTNNYICSNWDMWLIFLRWVTLRKWTVCCCYGGYTGKTRSCWKYNLLTRHVHNSLWHWNKHNNLIMCILCTTKLLDTDWHAFIVLIKLYMAYINMQHLCIKNVLPTWVQPRTGCKRKVICFELSPEQIGLGHILQDSATIQDCDASHWY